MSEGKKDSLRKLSTVDLEDIIAKAITEALDRTYVAEIESINFGERQPGNYDRDDCEIKLKVRYTKYSSSPNRVIGERPRYES